MASKAQVPLKWEVEKDQKKCALEMKRGHFYSLFFPIELDLPFTKSC